ncbi:root phototropism protein 3-like [Magnolia sinica]|uniref:root phototropism protein 3-like n=1 Tax=Magnolia sinica TaxID=86752 RepID=UPI0026583C33|nr:root phototropism protein 3-like [Magnolia sinica]
MRPLIPKPTEKKISFPKSDTTARNPTLPMTQFAVECWFDDACLLDMDYFIKTLSGVKAKGVRPDLIGSIIVHYASKWLPDLSSENPTVHNPIDPNGSPETITSTWMKKRFFVETLIGILPPEKDSVSCNFLLRLLRMANMVGVEPAYRAELEKRVSWQLDQASLKELMIPAFSHTCGTLLDVELVLQLVKRFVEMDEAAKSGAAIVKVARLIDCYLAEAAIDANLTLPDFIALGGALPSHARATDDGLYRAIDTYLKAHPNTSKQERKALCRLIDSRKLSPEASLHAAQNERLPVRAVIQVLFSENTKLHRQIDWSGSISGTHSPSTAFETPPLPSARCISKREVAAQQMEIRRLRDEVMRLQSHCNSMQAQLEKLLEKKKKKGIFRWAMIGGPLFRSAGVEDSVGEGDMGSERQTPAVVVKGRKAQSKTLPKWRKSMS